MICLFGIVLQVEKQGGFPVSPIEKRCISRFIRKERRLSSRMPSYKDEEKESMFGYVLKVSGPRIAVRCVDDV